MSESKYPRVWLFDQNRALGIALIRTYIAAHFRDGFDVMTFAMLVANGVIVL